jgi:hypothetical protein
MHILYINFFNEIPGDLMTQIESEIETRIYIIFLYENFFIIFYVLQLSNFLRNFRISTAVRWALRHIFLLYVGT